MVDSTESLLARAAAAIAESRRLTVKQRLVLQDMAAIYDRRVMMALKARDRLQLSEQVLMERYQRLAQA